MNQLLTEMDGVTAQKLVFFIGATNRPDILDQALMRPGRLDSLIYIGLPDFEARISIFKACLNKSPVDPSVDYELLADRTDGFSGADIAGVCKAAAKHAIRGAIEQERKREERRQQRMKAAEEKKEAIPDDIDEDKEPDLIPFLTREMLLSALNNTQRSVKKSDLERYMAYKRDMERRLGMDEVGASMSGMNNIVGLSAPTTRPAPKKDVVKDPSSAPPAAAPAAAPARTPAATPAAAPAGAPSSAPRDFGPAGQDDDIYD